MSSRKRSPKAKASTPLSTARATSVPIAVSYCSFEQGLGIGTSHSGRPAAAACARSSSLRTACIATRSAAVLIVVMRPTTSTSGSRRSSYSDQAESLPLLQERRVFRQDMASPSADASRHHWIGTPDPRRPFVSERQPLEDLGEDLDGV